MSMMHIEPGGAHLGFSALVFFEAFQGLSAKT